MLPHKRKKRKLDHSADAEESEAIPDSERHSKQDKSHKEDNTEVKPKRKISAPPPLKFDQLLQIAEKKQFEPILIVESKIKKEPERLMTHKEKMELERSEVRKITKKNKPDGVITNGKDTNNKPKDKDSKDYLPKKGGKSLSDQFDKKLNGNIDRNMKNELENKRDSKQKSESLKTGQNKEKLNAESATERLKKDSNVWTNNLYGQNSKLTDKKKMNDMNKPKVVHNVKDNVKLLQKNSLDLKSADTVKCSKLKDLSSKEKESDIDKQLELLKLKKAMLAEKTKLKKLELMKMKLANQNKRSSQQDRRPIPSKSKLIKLEMFIILCCIADIIHLYRLNFLIFQITRLFTEIFNSDVFGQLCSAVIK